MTEDAALWKSEKTRGWRKKETNEWFVWEGKFPTLHLYKISPMNEPHAITRVWTQNNDFPVYLKKRSRAIPRLS